jgi:hypothetical protein
MKINDEGRIFVVNKKKKMKIKMRKKKKKKKGSR